MNKDCYLITYAGGTCGAFISAILYLWLADDPRVLEFPYLGCSHEHDYLISDNWKLPGYPPNVEQMFAHTKPRDISKPFVVRQHYQADTALLNKLYPRNIHFNIIYSEDDRDIILAFLYFKQFVTEFHSNNTGMKKEFDLWFEQFGQVFDPNAISMKQKRHFIEMMANYRFGTSWNEVQPEGATTLTLSNILRHPEAILSQIGNAIEKSIPDNIRRSYDNYLRVNKNLIRTETPWIDYFDK